MPWRLAGKQNAPSRLLESRTHLFIRKLASFVSLANGIHTHRRIDYIVKKHIVGFSMVNRGVGEG